MAKITLNGFLENVRAGIIKHYREISDRASTITAEKVKKRLPWF